MSIKDLPEKALPAGSLILVTGSSGFIAANIVREALENGYRVRGTVRSQEKAEKTKKIFNSSNYDTVVVPEMEHKGAFDEAVKNVDAIIHTASPATFSPNPNEVVRPAVNGTISILESALKEPSVKRFVFTSSSVAATTPNLDKKVKIDKHTWNSGYDQFADYPPPYDSAKGFDVYVASKLKSEEALWRFVKEKQPHFVVNAVLPNFNAGRLLGESGLTASMILSTYRGDVDWSFQSQYMIDVVDDARIHLSAAIDSGVNNERIFAFANVFSWNDVLDVFREVKPDRNYPDNRDVPRDLTEVDNQLGADLLRKWWGQDGYTGIKESLLANIEGVA